MAKNSNKLDDLSRQNRLLREQNELLREQIELLKNLPAQDEREVFVDNIDRDEMRNGFLVTSHRKKLWNAQIGLINELARICKKHSIRWYAIGGTLLGAARHGGFIPWDDDVDIIMFRPDYEKFKSVVEDELKSHPRYQMWYWFNYRLESDTEAAQQVEPNLPLISRKQANTYPAWAPLFPLLRLLDSSTTFMMPDSRKNVFSSIWVDIFCLDPCPPFADDGALKNFEAARELLLATVFPEQVKAALNEGKKFLIRSDELFNFLDLPYKARAQRFDSFSAKNFIPTPCVAEIKYHSINDRKAVYKTKDFSDVTYLPFEKIEVPAPKNFDGVLTDFYGDWRKLVMSWAHSQEYSADISYEEYSKTALFLRLQR